MMAGRCSQHLCDALPKKIAFTDFALGEPHRHRGRSCHLSRARPVVREAIGFDDFRKHFRLIGMMAISGATVPAWRGNRS